MPWNFNQLQLKRIHGPTGEMSLADLAALNGVTPGLQGFFDAKTATTVLSDSRRNLLDSAEFSYAAKAWTSADSGIGSGR